MLVEVDLSKPLIRGTSLRFEGDKRWILFKYELLPLFCFYCGKVGHAERLCECKTQDAKNGMLNKGQFGDWMRTGSGRMSIKGRPAVVGVSDQLITKPQGDEGNQGRSQRVEGRLAEGDRGGKAGGFESGRNMVAKEGQKEGGTSAVIERKGKGGKLQLIKKMRYG